MFKVDYVELTRDVAQGKEHTLEMALRDAMNEAAGEELPLSILFEQSKTITKKVIEELKNLDFGNKPVSFTEDFFRGFFPNFIESFKRSYNSAKA